MKPITDLRRMIAARVLLAGGVRPLSRESGLSPSHVSRILSGKCKPSDKTLKRIGIECIRTTLYRLEGRHGS